MPECCLQVGSLEHRVECRQAILADAKPFSNFRLLRQSLPAIAATTSPNSNFRPPHQSSLELNPLLCFCLTTWYTVTYIRARRTLSYNPEVFDRPLVEKG